MAFLENIKRITQPKIVEAEFDFGEGKETVRFKSLTYNQRQDIFVKRLDKEGKLDISGSALHMNAELIAATLVDADGKTVATSEAVRQWDSQLVDKLADLAGRTLGLIEKKVDEENPSNPQS